MHNKYVRTSSCIPIVYMCDSTMPSYVFTHMYMHCCFVMLLYRISERIHLNLKWQNTFASGNGSVAS